MIYKQSSNTKKHKQIITLSVASIILAFIVFGIFPEEITTHPQLNPEKYGTTLGIVTAKSTHGSRSFNYEVIFTNQDSVEYTVREDIAKEDVIYEKGDFIQINYLLEAPRKARINPISKISFNQLLLIGAFLLLLLTGFISKLIYLLAFPKEEGKESWWDKMHFKEFDIIAQNQNELIFRRNLYSDISNIIATIISFVLFEFMGNVFDSNYEDKDFSTYVLFAGIATTGYRVFLLVKHIIFRQEYSFDLQKGVFSSGEFSVEINYIQSVEIAEISGKNETSYVLKLRFYNQESFEINQFSRQKDVLSLSSEIAQAIKKPISKI
jgi:hypothetical protein